MNVFLDEFQQLLYLFNGFYQLLNNPSFLIVLQIISLTVLSKIIANLFQNFFKNPSFSKQHLLLVFFCLPIIAIMTENISTLAKFIYPKTSITRVLLCIAWIFSSIKFHSFLLFLEKLTEKNFYIKPLHKFFFICEFILCSFCISDVIHLIMHERHILYSNYFYYITIIFWIISIIPSIKTIIQKLTSNNIPIILKNQLKILLTFFILPHILCILLEFTPLLCSGQLKIENNILIYNNLAMMLILISFYICYKKIMRFRFLNLADRVYIKPTINISTQFKDSIEQINTATNLQEISYITQQFFHEQFQIPKKAVAVYLRTKDISCNTTQQHIETFFNNEKNANKVEIAYTQKIFVLDEIEFDAYCSQDLTSFEFLNFLQSIACNVIIPIFNNKKLLGYITVAKDSTIHPYNFEQQNKMIIFAQFLAPAIHMISQQNMYQLLQESKETKEALYAKHQEVNQYKESIKRLLKDRIENHIGIIFYKNKHFTFKNKEAEQLLGINPNMQHNHPTTAMLINLAQQVEKFKTTQSMCITIHMDKKLIVSAMPHAESSGGVFMTIRQPEPTDIIKSQLDALKDPSKRDYLLYLETTNAGQLINKLLPSNSEAILALKITLLEIVLQKQSLFLQAHKDDINEIASIIHNVSLKQHMHILQLHEKQTQDTAIELFGISQLLNPNQQQPLLETMNHGTLIIKNIEFLDAMTQKKLAYFIRYGIFSPLKSEQRKYSDVRIIFSSKDDLQNLWFNKLIIKELYDELNKNIISIPSCTSFNQEDIVNLIDGFIQQTIIENTDKTYTVPCLNDKEKLLESPIESFIELKHKIQKLLVQKEKATQLNTSNTSCSEFELAAQLGKQALKDIKLMTFLWNKMKNQTKIAELLGVNRSSVNRRCKDYNLS